MQHQSSHLQRSKRSHQERPARRRRRSSRNRSQNQADQKSSPLLRKTPVIELLSEAEVIKLEHHADWILSEIGVEIREDDESLQLFRAAGA